MGQPTSADAGDSSGIHGPTDIGSEFFTLKLFSEEIVNRLHRCVGKCAWVHGQKLWCPSLEGYGPMDGVSMSVNVQGSTDKNSSAPPWRDMGQWMEFPCPEMCRDLWIKTLVPLPGGIWPNGWSVHV